MIQQKLLEDARVVRQNAKLAANEAFKRMQIKIEERRAQKFEDDSAV